MTINKSVVFIDDFVFNHPKEENKPIIDKFKELMENGNIKIYNYYNFLVNDHVTNFYIISPKIFISFFFLKIFLVKI
jgi:hypothetical protein